LTLPLYLLVFILGLLFGSFLNVVIYRLPREESIVTPGSHCPQCNTQLSAGELIPVISYLLQKGRCKTCDAQISSRYPLVELATAVLLTLQVHFFGFVLPFLFFGLMTLILVAITMIDYDLQIIPDELNLLLLILGIVYLLVVRLPEVGLRGLLPSLIGFLVGGGLFLAIAVLSGGGMGGGDVKLMAVLGLWFGWKQLLVLMFLSFVSGAVISLFLLATKIKGRKDAIPFGPFIALAAYLTSIFGPAILRWYPYF
jgi:leader peptidase (prepilin peptidase) / N-methyltransferase